MAVAGSITLTATDVGGGYTKYSAAWVSSAGGAVTENPISVKRGFIRQAKFIPDGGGTQPTDAYDATVVDAISGGADYLAGAGADLSQTNRKIAAPNTWWEGGNLYPTIANAGNAKGGTLVLIVGP